MFKETHIIGIGSDHIGYELKDFLKQHLQQNEWNVKDFGPYNQDQTDYPIFAQKLALAINKKEADAGILICGTGIGVSMAANKIKGVRCALCSEEYSAKMSRLHNNANILALGARVIGKDMAVSILNSWLETAYEGGRHEKRVQQLDDFQNYQIK